jgi:hypothetical protein
METTTTSQGRASRASSANAHRAHSAQHRRTAARRSPRAHVATAFREMAHGVREQAAWASTLAFYRSGGRAWSKNLG